MRKYQTIVGIISVAMMGSIAFPVSAQTTTEQTASQGVSIDGNDNTVYQTIYQTTINHPSQGQSKKSFPSQEFSTKYKNSKDKPEKKEKKEKSD